MKKKIIILAAIFAQIIQTSCNQKSEDDTNYLEIFQDVKSEAESLVLINDLIEKDEIIGLHGFLLQINRCLHHTIHKGWFNASSTLIAKYYNPKQRDLYEEFVKIRKKLKLENIQIFSNLTNLLPDQSPSLVKAEPCYMWAQNMTHIFMKIKFSPKIDVPGKKQVFLKSLNNIK